MLLRALRLAVILAAVAGSAERAAAQCRPAVVLAGDASAVAEVAGALAERGVATERAPACEGASATVSRGPGGLALTVRARGDRTESRVVADAATAAAWLESWVRDDAAPLWALIVAPPVAKEPPLRPPSHGDFRPNEQPAAPSRGAIPRGIAVLVGRDFASDGSTWRVIAAAACVRVGRWCFGGTARLATNDKFFDADRGNAANRRAIAAAATVDWRAHLGPLAIAPQLIAGAGRVATERDDDVTECLPLCPGMPQPVRDGFKTSTIAARLGAGASLTLPLVAWLSLEGRVGAEAALGAHDERHEHDPDKYPVNAGLGFAPNDPLLDLPGEPAWAWTAAVGLRAEVP